jgi:inactivated superfamily I helicase
MSSGAPRALSEWLQLMLAEIAAKRADSERARGEASRRAAESADAARHPAPPAAAPKRTSAR